MPNRSLLLIMPLLWIGSGTRAATPPLVVHVSQTGSDNNDGSSPTQIGDRHGPLRTVQHARDVARALRSGGNASAGVTIALGSGDYVLDQTLSLNSLDSGRPEAPTMFTTEPGATVRMTGGPVIGNWQSGPDGEIDAPWTGACVSQLFVNGNRRERPRLPASGWLAIGAVDARGSDNAPVTDHFTVRNGDLPARFAISPQTEILVLDAWTASRMRIRAYDPASGRLQLLGRFAGYGNHRDLSAGLPYMIENMPTATLAPGTWQCDATKAMLRYQPMRGENASSLVAIAPHLEQLVQIAGNENDPAHDIVWRGIKFEYVGWKLPANGWAAMQGEVGLPAAIQISHARNIVFDKIAIAHTGATGLRIGLDAVGVVLSGSQLSDLGASGVEVGSDQRKPLPGSNWTGGTSARDETHNITISGNLITNIGRVQPGGIGIWSGQASHVSITDNRISNLFYTGISLGWVWNDGPSLSHDNVVRGNDISNFGQGVLSDFGGIYTLGSQPGTVVADNRITGGHARDYGGHGLYADQGSGGIRFEGNFVSDTSQAPIQVTEGTNLTFIGNRMQNFGEAVIYCDQPSPGQSVQFINNSASTPMPVPATRGKCADPSYKISANSFILGNQTHNVEKPFGVTGAGADYQAPLRHK